MDENGEPLVMYHGTRYDGFLGGRRGIQEQRCQVQHRSSADSFHAPGEGFRDSSSEHRKRERRGIQGLEGWRYGRCRCETEFRDCPVGRAADTSSTSEPENPRKILRGAVYCSKRIIVDLVNPTPSPTHPNRPRRHRTACTSARVLPFRGCTR